MINQLLIKAGILFSSLFLVGCEGDVPPTTTPDTNNTGTSVEAPQNNNNNNTDTSNNSTNNGSATTFPEVSQPVADGITVEEAKAIALAHAGVNEAEVKYVTSEFEYEKGVPEYEIEFYVGNLEYDYEIHAITGEILSFDQEIEFGKPVIVPSSDTADGYLSQDEIKDMILTHAGVAEGDISRLTFDFEMEKGVPEFEVEFYVGSVEYDYEVNAKTGEILSFSQETDGKPSNNTGSGTTAELLGEAEVKAIALEHAGVSEGDISHYTIKFEYDDGIYEYEIEFNVGKTEYEFEINGLTGAIISYEQDKD